MRWYIIVAFILVVVCGLVLALTMIAPEMASQLLTPSLVSSISQPATEIQTFQPTYATGEYTWTCTGNETVYCDYIDYVLNETDVIFDIEVPFNSVLTPSLDSYVIPETLKLEVNLVKPTVSYIPKTLIKSDELSLTPDKFEVGDKNKFEFVISRNVNYIKVGEESIIITKVVDAEVDGVLINIANEVNATHLNMTNNTHYQQYLHGYFPFDADISGVTSAVVNDYYLGNNGLNKGVGIVNDTLGIYGSAWWGNGKNNNITTDILPTTGSKAHSGMAWIYPEVNGNDAVLSWGDSGINTRQFIFGTYGTTQVAVLIRGCELGTHANNFTTNQWTHIAYTYTAGATSSAGFKIYVNGIEQKLYVLAGSCGIAPNLGSGTDMYIGNSIEGSTPRYWKGALDEIMIFNTTLSVSYIQNVYNNQSGRYSNSNSVGTLTPKFINTSEAESNLNLTLNDYDLVYQNTNISLRVGEWKGNQYNDTNDDYLLGYWHLDSNYSDASRNGKHASVHGDTTNTTGIWLGGQIFDGTGDYLNVTGLDSEGNTQSAWVLNSSDTEWRHVARVDGTNYSNGISVGSVIVPISNQTDYVRIGDGFTGRIDEVMIFNKSLTAQEVKSLYATGNLNHTSNSTGVLWTWQPYQNVTGKGNNLTFSVDGSGTNFLSDILFQSNSYSSFSPVVKGSITYDFFAEGGAPADNEYPLFFNYSSTNNTYAGLLSNFSVSINSTNGTVFLQINNTNITAVNSSTPTIFTAFSNLTNVGIYPYQWISWGNGTSALFNISATQEHSVNQTYYDNEYPIFFNYTDTNNTYAGAMGNFSVSINSTNGTVFLQINNTNLTADNSSNTFYVSYNLTNAGAYIYHWISWGNGTDANFNISVERIYNVNVTYYDNEYPLFFNITDNNATNAGQWANFTTTVNSTNGTVFLQINSVNYTSSNISNIFNVAVNLTTGNVYAYQWLGWGNGTSHNFNISGTYHFTVIAPPADLEYPLFFNVTDNNATNEGMWANFTTTINSTNGTTFLQINNLNYTASNTSNIFNVAVNLTASGVFNYYWLSWGNGTTANFNMSRGYYFTVNFTGTYHPTDCGNNHTTIRIFQTNPSPYVQLCRSYDFT